MEKYKKILVPIDLSEISHKIVPYAIAMADKFQSEIHLLFVARILDYFSGYYVSVTTISNFQNQIVKGTQKSLSEFKEKYFKNMPNVTALVEIGDISEKILSYVQENEMDLIIMGTHGRKGLDKAIFGSVAERVAKTATVPVLLINPYRIKADLADSGK